MQYTLLSIEKEAEHPLLGLFFYVPVVSCMSSVVFFTTVKALQTTVHYLMILKPTAYIQGLAGHIAGIL